MSIRSKVKKKYKVLFPIETSSRELSGRLKIAMSLACRGDIEVIICSREWAYDHLLTHNVNFVLFKSLDRKSMDLYLSYKNRGIQMGLLHAEGGLFYRDMTPSLQSIYHDDYYEILDLNFVWGQKILENMRKLGLRLFEKSYVTGEPRFVYSEIKKRLNTNLSVLLFNSSFSITNPLLGRDKLMEYWMSSDSLTDEAKKSLLYKREIFDEIFEEYYCLLKRILQTTNYSLIIRPHPSENPSVYDSLLRDYENRVIVTKEPLKDVLPKVDVVLHYDCTTAIESLLAGKQVFSYQPFENSYAAWLPVEVSRQFSSMQELLSELRLPKNDLHIASANLELLKSYLGQLDGSSEEVISDLIYANLCQQSGNKLYLTRIPIKAIVLRLLIRLRNKFLKKEVLIMSKKKFKKFNKTDFDIQTLGNQDINIISDEAIRVTRLS